MGLWELVDRHYHLHVLESHDQMQVHQLTFCVRMLWVQPKFCKALVCFINCIYRCFHEYKDVKVLEEILRACCLLGESKRETPERLPRLSPGKHMGSCQE